MSWVAFSLLAALFYALRYVLIKKYLSGASSFVIAFSMRFFGALASAPLIFLAGPGRIEGRLFWAVIAATGVLTGISSLIQFHALKNFEISSSLPFLSFIPFFMAFWVYLIFGSLPGIHSSFGMLLLCSGAYALNRAAAPAPGEKARTGAPYAFGGGALFFISAAILGLTTVLDKLAIENAGAGGIRYSICWNAFSTILFAPFFAAGARRRGYMRQFRSHLGAFALQGALGAAAFCCQMLAVEYCRHAAADVIYVKSLTMMQIFFAVVIAASAFGEKSGKAGIAASAAMIAGAAVVSASK